MKSFAHRGQEHSGISGRGYLHQALYRGRRRPFRQLQRSMSWLAKVDDSYKNANPVYHELNIVNSSGKQESLPLPISCRLMLFSCLLNAMVEMALRYFCTYTLPTTVPLVFLLSVTDMHSRFSETCLGCTKQ